MVPLFLAARELGRALAAVWRDPETKALPVVAGALVLTGTLFYWRFEDWTIIESLYFCIVTLTTVGYGDFAPTTVETQIFTIVYILTGFGVLVALLTSVAQEYMKNEGREPQPARASTRPSIPRPAGCGGRPGLSPLSQRRSWLRTGNGWSGFGLRLRSSLQQRRFLYSSAASSSTPASSVRLVSHSHTRPAIVVPSAPYVSSYVANAFT